MSLFSAVELAPRDPIFGLTEQYIADTNPSKVNLGLGVYTGEDGKIPVLKCVAIAQKQISENIIPKGYQPIDGMAAYTSGVKDLIFGQSSDVVKSGRVVAIQALGGTGALKVGADFLQTLTPDVPVMVSDPSWENHRALFSRAGFQVVAYPYYDAEKRAVNFEGMLNAFKVATKGTIVLLHPCCHNPTGYDLSEDQWDQLIEVMRSNGLVPFLDMAYQGFGSGLKQDGVAVAKLVDSGLNFLLSSSFSKTFSLYGERVGALSIVCTSQDEAKRVLSQVKLAIRTNYSNPPTFGAQLVSTVLGTPDLRTMWENELESMRVRIQGLRDQLLAKLKAAGVTEDMSFISAQNGMFSYSGLSKDQMVRLRSDFSIYGLDSGRICVASLNAKNIDYVAQAIATVAKA